MEQKKIQKIALVLIAFIIFIFSINLPVSADVGDFESYSSGGSSDSSWSSSSSSSSWGSSSRWDDDDYYYSSGSSGNASWGEFIIVFIIIVIMVIYASRKGNNNFNTGNIPNYVQPEDEVLRKIKAIDENFNKDEFNQWARDLFIKLQYAWSDRDWEAIRCFETNELYEQHSTQLQRYVQNKQINMLERVSVNWVKLLSFEQSGDKDVLSIVLNSKMIDYIIDEETKQIIKGNKEEQKVNNYKLTFIRKTGVKTEPGSNQLKVTNCPNCGAPTKITSAGKCEYCGSVITTGEHSWVLSNLERYNNII